MAAYLLLVDALALVWVVRSVATTGFDVHGLGVLLLLVVTAIGFEEGSSRAARLQIRLSAPMRTDMTSVWAVCAAVALAPAHGVMLLIAVCVYVWFRQQRPAGEALFRKWFVASTIVAGSLVAGDVYTFVRDAAADLPWGLGSPLAIVAAIVAYTVCNRGLVSVVLLLTAAPLRNLVGSLHDNLIELATLCLGGLVALAVMFEPWLVILVLAPMVSLQRTALVRELEQAAITDAKTRLLNAVAWEHLAQREISRAERERQGLAVLIIDIDRFKGVNDRFGHLAGDKVLATVARTIEASVREYDGLGRFGGEEFVAVLPDCDERTAMLVAERVRARVNQVDVGEMFAPPASGPLAPDRLSVSVGVALLRLDGSELTDLLHAADQALYRAKHNGRNQVQLARRGGEVPDRVVA
ncbi:diguanylate cyclase (GGDEF) domain-containing protein [Jatrophihabitans endophyticus]|uniref:Diguanylate cyclase (GGDEF) domain-containing protein n=2 Tax=Jatrophihabitans endophyticus TaxID=1206085 RepID=A0A1M5U9D2_9ACTN|nr:diguanylate cyclase (GGDEF) domain-containing protein [Jatrophihabitans endophyticus]